MAKIVKDFEGNNGHAHIHTRTAKNTKLHHPSIHSDNDTDSKHNTSNQFRTHLDQSRNCFVSSFACLWMRSVDSLLVNKGMGRGSPWSLLDLDALESDVSSGKSAKDGGWPSSSVRQRVAALKRGDAAPRCVGGAERRLKPEQWDEMREFVEEEHVRSVTIRFTLSRPCSRRLSVW